MPKAKGSKRKSSASSNAAEKTAEQATRDSASGDEPGASSVGPEPMKKQGETYPLRLSPQQRASLIHATRVRGGIKDHLRAVKGGTQVVEVTAKELDHLDDELGQATLVRGPDRQRLLAVWRQVGDLLVSVEDASGPATDSTLLKTSPKSGPVVLQFKIMLLDVKPPIWRRIQVEDGPLEFFHEDIQAAFGWENDHLYRFEINGRCYGPAEDDFDLDESGDGDGEDDGEVALSDLLKTRKRKPRWIYLYDFGDGWRHLIVFEGFVPHGDMSAYPLCLGGARACPPEDCGGPWGYSELCAAVADRRHKRYHEFREWLGPFDPEAFDAKRATKAMQRGQDDMSASAAIELNAARADDLASEPRSRGPLLFTQYDQRRE